MAHKQSAPLGQRRRISIGNGNRGLVERVVKGVEIGARLQLLKGFYWVGNGHRGLRRWRF